MQLCSTAAFASRQTLSSPPDLIDLLPVAIYACDAQGRVLWFNGLAVELWGRAPRIGDDTELFCGSYKLHFNGRVIERHETPMSQVLRSGEPIRGVEGVVERPDGSRLWAMVNIDPIFDACGNLIGAINCFHDTTALHDLQEDLARKHQELDDFFENAAVGLHLVSADGTILRANKAELDLLGYSAEDYVGREIAEIHADAHVIADILARLKRGEELKNYPARLRAKDGSIKHVQITSNAQFQGGELCNTRCFTIDVTPSKLAEDRLLEGEERFLQLLEALPAAVYTTDAEGRITYYNQAAIEMSGRRPELGTDKWCVTWRLFWPDGTPLPHDECPMAIALKENKIVRGYEAIAERPDGTRVPFIPYPTPLRDSSGNLVGAVNMLVDISERKNSETQQRVLLDELNHRVKNNMQMLHGLLASAEREVGNPDARSVLADASQRVAAMAAAQTVLYTTQNAAFDAPEFIRAVCHTARQAFSDSVHLDCEATPVSLSNDTAMPLALIVNELLTNAVKYGQSPDGEVSIRIRLERDDKGFVLVVEDGGTGFDLSRVSRRASGLGLVRGLARQLGGTFEVERLPHTRCVVRFIDRHTRLH
jgi:PAS domain S-box-containing protein